MSKKLSELADIFISSVDKKIREGEQEVLLCNFTDIYKNWAITERKREKFLTATAKQKEIETFCLKKGQVAITKDSETKFDIGESSYIADDFEDVILGYHTVLIKPFKDILDGKYLNAYFKTDMIKRYFENNATGSGQRYTLPIDVLNDMPIVLPDIGYQRVIGNIFSYIDRKIELNNQINDNLSNMAQDIYMHYFFKKSPNGKLNDIIFEADKSKVQVGDAKNCIGQYPFFTSGASILTWNEYFVDGRYCFLNTGGNADVKFYVGKSAYSTDTWCIYTNNNMTDYLYLLLSTLKEELNKKHFQGTGLKHLQKDLLRNKDIYIPSEAELYNFNNIIKPLFDSISKNIREIEKLVRLRDFLLPLLMNGQATIE